MENKKDLIITEDVFCTSCGTKNNKENIFCSSCGKELKKREKDLLVSKNDNVEFKLSKESYFVFGIGLFISLYLWDDGGLLFLGFLIVAFLLYVKSQKKSNSNTGSNKIDTKDNNNKNKNGRLNRDSILGLIFLGLFSSFFFGPLIAFVFFIFCCFALSVDNTITFFMSMVKFFSVITIIMLIMFGICVIPLIFYG